ncbi:hypothetical protein [Mycobacterium sp.]|uniref:hypothetical protein n=1 Tax=Mycobacterium sp. TaxID=1785 RepID=UPI003F97BE82
MDGTVSINDFDENRSRARRWDAELGIFVGRDPCRFSVAVAVYHYRHARFTSLQPRL